jgi:hypothetical protein
VVTAKKPVGWMQSPEARKDRTDPMMAGHRKDHGRRLRALPKAARRAIQVERLARKQKFVVAGNTAAQLSNLSEGRMQLIANVGKRKNKLTPGQIDAITRSMTQSARRLKVGLATGNRGRMKYNPKALQLAPSTAARTIRGARVGGVARKGKAAPSKPAAPKRVTAGRQGGTIAKLRGLKPGALAAKRQKPAGKQKKPLTKERISAAKGKITAKLTAVLDEIRKVENAKNRDNTPASSGSGFSPRYLKLIARGQKADKQLESLRRASKRLKQIELNYDPAKYGYGRGTDQRKSLAAEIRNARKQLTTLQREEATAKKAYEADPVVKFGLWGEIGQNRKQSRKAKERRSNASMNRADRYIGARIAIRQQQNAIKQLRDKAKRQTQETNKRQKPRNR